VLEAGEKRAMLLKKGIGPAYTQVKGGSRMKTGEGGLKDLEMRDVDSMIQFMPNYLEKLQSKIDILPKVDKEGRSECPFAEDLYFEKDQEAEEVAKKLKRLRLCLEFVVRELTRLRQDLARTMADAGSLHLKKAKEEYSHAVRSLRVHIKKNIDRRNKLIDLISQTEKLLNTAHSKKWPLGKPKERRRFPAIPSGQKSSFGSGVISSTPALSGPPLKGEIGNLLSLGPIGTAQPLVTAK
jgi:hypothetical protein